MGFIDGLSRLLRGKPVFEDPALRGQPTPPENELPPPIIPQPVTPAPPSVQEASTVSAKPGYAENGQKIIPEVRLEHCKPHLHDETTTLTAWVTNISPLEIELDKVEFGRTKRELDRRLRPNEGREITLYQGPVFRDDHIHDIVLTYKVMVTGDYFQAQYYVEYDFQSNGVYLVEDLHRDGPIRDI